MKRKQSRNQQFSEHLNLFYRAMRMRKTPPWSPFTGEFFTSRSLSEKLKRSSCLFAWHLSFNDQLSTSKNNRSKVANHQPQGFCFLSLYMPQLHGLNEWLTGEECFGTALRTI
jgi:hypothetical protein